MIGQFFYGMPSETLEIYFYILLPFISGWIDKTDMDWLSTLETKDRLITWPLHITKKIEAILLLLLGLVSDHEKNLL